MLRIEAGDAQTPIINTPYFTVYVAHTAPKYRSVTSRVLIIPLYFLHAHSRYVRYTGSGVPCTTTENRHNYVCQQADAGHVPGIGGTNSPTVPESSYPSCC